MPTDPQVEGRRDEQFRFECERCGFAWRSWNSDNTGCVVCADRWSAQSFRIMLVAVTVLTIVALAAFSLAVVL
jgi:ribosomal protein L37E